MFDRTVSTVIDAEKCIGCGLCVAVCPSGTISGKTCKALKKDGFEFMTVR